MSEGIIEIAIGIGLVVSLLLSELMGFAAGGMVVPGYFALSIKDPVKVIMSFLVALLAHFTVKAIGSFLVLYGKRHTVLVMLIAFVYGFVVRRYLEFQVGSYPIDLNIIGYIVPGIVALWMERQGIFETMMTLIISTVIVRMCLVLVMGGRLF